MPSTTNLTILLPCKNEAASLGEVLKCITETVPRAEILVVDDGSTDDSASMAREHGATVISHRYSMGNGAAIKTGLRHASGDVMVCMDADGQHSPRFIEELVQGIDEGYDMVVGARKSAGQSNLGRSLANRFYNWFAGLIVGHNVQDLTSGLRAFRKKYALDFIHLLPNGFSYPTTLTIAFFRAGYSVKYVPIEVRRRIGKSHISPLTDGIRFLLIIFKIGTLYSPLKIFFPLSLALMCSGIGWYIHTYMSVGRFTNMSAILILSALVVFLMGLISEQITTLLYSREGR